MRTPESKPVVAKAKASLSDSWPLFMDLLDSNPRRAWEEFHAFAWKLTRFRGPGALVRLSNEEREDLLADIVQDFQRDQFRILRRYENKGRPFAVWFWLVVKRKALDRLKAMKIREYENIPDWVMDSTPSPAEEASGKTALEDIRKVIRQLSPRCQLLLMATAEGYKPRDLLELESLPYADSKKLSDHLKNCRRSLIKAMVKQGYTVDDFLG